jgi:glycosyltransferase involved in cell wall biosynthesis
MNVLHVIPSMAARVGGTVTYVAESCLALNARGVTTTIFTTDQGHAPTIRLRRRATIADLPPEARPLDVHLFRSSWPYKLVNSPALGTALNERVSEFDLVHIHNLFLYPQFSAARACRRRGVPYIVSLHGALDPYLRRRGRLRKGLTDLLWQRRMLECATAIHVLTDEERRMVADITPEVPRVVVSGGVNTGRFKHLPDGGSFRARFLDEPLAPLVLYVGRISHKKGLDILIRALAEVQRRMPSSRLAIVGPDDEGLTTMLRSVARRAGVSDRTVFTGPLFDEELKSALAACDVWVLSSHSEGFSIAVIEALAAGVPVVTSPAVNIAAEMAAAHAGLVAELTPEAFALRILEVLTDKDLCAQLRAQGPKFVQRYDWATVGPELVRMYRTVLTLAGRIANPHEPPSN